VDIVLNSRHVELTERFRSHVEEKLARLEKHDHRVIRVEVEVVRAEPAAEDKMAALDLAVDRMAAQMRRAADRRRVHRGRHTPVSVGQAMAGIEPEPNSTTAEATADAEHERHVGPIAVLGDGPLVVREKIHSAAPMTLDQALYEMELVGHDFFLFVDKESERPSVVYRRRGYDYGVITLDLT
jgi:ribosome-associated translation inhibitor RaiA